MMWKKIIDFTRELDLQNEFEEIDSEFNRTFKKEVLLIF
jgi:hypothetical protein